MLALALCAGLAAAGAASLDEPDAKLGLRKVADVPLPGSTTRWDYESVDARSHRLFIAHLGDSVVTVFDTAAQKIIAEIPGIGHVHGVLVVPELDRVYASATRSDEVVAIDATTLTIVARIPGGAYPDGMAYAPAVRKLYVSDETGKTETVIDAASNTLLATIPLGGEVGNTQYDPVSRHIFVNVQSRAELVEIDPASDQIAGRYPIPGAKGNHGLLIEPSQRLAFLACEDNDKLIVFDLNAKAVMSSFDVGADPDVLAWSPSLHRLYVAGEKGVLSIFRAEGRSVTKLVEGRVGPNAHVVAVDELTHRLYLPLKDLGGKPTLRIMEAEAP